MSEYIYHNELQTLSPTVVPMPEVTFVPRTETSVPFNAADRQELPAELEKYGYIEEEFFIGGQANIYEYHDVGLYPKMRASGGRYDTRILVRRPKNPEKASGFAIVEIINYAGPCEKPQAGWGNCGEYYMSRGDAWIGVTAKQSAIDCLKRYDAERYAPLGFPNPVAKELRRPNRGFMPGGSGDDYENGLFWDAFSQIGAVLKSYSPSNPLLHGLRMAPPAKWVLATGASGCDLSLYAAAIHPFARIEGMKPVYDGYLIHMTGYPGNISNGEVRFSADDDRCKIYTDVPLVWTQTMGDMRGGGIHPSYSYMYRHPDSNLPGRQYRQYEIAGAPINANWDRRVIPCKSDVEKATATEWNAHFEFDEPNPDFPTRYVLRAVIDSLKRWVKDGVPAPASAYLDMVGEYPDADFVLDEHGNPKGGVRSPYVDVPTCTYHWEDDFKVENEIIPFTEEKLAALYPTHEDYVLKVVASTMKMIERGFLLPEDAEEIISDAVKRA